jgi:predicted dehydrogenase
VPRLRWGICGPGWIAERFVSTLKEHTSQEILGVQSRDPARARAFAEKVGIPKSFTGNGMMADPKIDVVYVATVHPRHLPDALAAALSEQILGLSPAVLASAHEQSVPIF